MRCFYCDDEIDIAVYDIEGDAAHCSRACRRDHVLHSISTALFRIAAALEQWGGARVSWFEQFQELEDSVGQEAFEEVSLDDLRWLHGLILAEFRARKRGEGSE